MSTIFYVGFAESGPLSHDERKIVNEIIDRGISYSRQSYFELKSKEHEEMLSVVRTSELRYRRLYQTKAIGISIFKADGCVIDANRACS
jgi:hypothetical protein